MWTSTIYSLRTLHPRSALHERRQRKGVAGVLAPEDGEQRAVHDEEHAAPGDEGDALGPGVADPGDFDGQGNSGQSEDTICVF